MMARLFSRLLLSSLLVGCAGTPIPPESEYNDIRVKVEWRDQQWFEYDCPIAGYPSCVVYGFVIAVNNHCVIFTPKPVDTNDDGAFEYLGRHLLHCTDGDYE